MVTYLRAALYSVPFCFRRQLRWKRMLVVAAILIFLCALVVLSGRRVAWQGDAFGEWIVERLLALFYLPVVCLVFGTGALAESREDGTLVFLVTAPIPRWVTFLSHFVAVIPLALAFSLGGLWILCQLAATPQHPDILQSYAVYAPAFALGSVAYVALFHCAAALFRHATLLAFAYVFFIEVFLGNVPGILKCFSVSYYVRSLLMHAGELFGVPRPPELVFAPMDPAGAMRVLIWLAVGVLCCGAVIFSRREYLPQGG